jgi:hypothetical protein
MFGMNERLSNSQLQATPNQRSQLMNLIVILKDVFSGRVERAYLRLSHHRGMVSAILGGGNALWGENLIPSVVAKVGSVF